MDYFYRAKCEEPQPEHPSPDAKNLKGSLLSIKSPVFRSSNGSGPSFGASSAMAARLSFGIARETMCGTYLEHGLTFDVQRLLWSLDIFEWGWICDLLLGCVSQYFDLLLWWKHWTYHETWILTENPTASAAKSPGVNIWHQLTKLQKLVNICQPIKPPKSAAMEAPIWWSWWATGPGWFTRNVPWKSTSWNGEVLVIRVARYRQIPGRRNQ